MSERASWRSAVAAFGRRHGLDQRARVAMAMALIATLGAVTAYEASQHELDATICQHSADEAREDVLAERQAFLDREVENARWGDQRKLAVARARALSARAQTLRADPAPSGVAGVLEAEAQIEHAYGRILGRMTSFTYVGLDDKLSLEDGLTARAQENVRRVGFRNRCDPRAPSALPIASASGFKDFYAPLTREIGRIRETAVREAFVVCLFVLALGLLSTSQIFQAAGRLRLGLAGAGVAIVAIAVALWAEPRLAIDYLTTFVAFAAFGTASWLFIVRRMRFPSTEEHAGEHVAEVHEFDHEGFMGKHVHFVVVKGRFDAIVVAFVAVAAFASALAAWGYTYAEARAARLNAAAAIHESDMLRERTRKEAALFSVIGEFTMLEEAALRRTTSASLANESRRGLLPGTAWPLINAEQERWRSTSDVLFPAGDPMNQGARDTMNGSDGPYLDDRFPARLFYRATVSEPAVQLALWDADAERAASWDQQAASYLGILTMFAIALYLFGQALGMARSEASALLAIFGAALLVYGAARGLESVARPSPHPDARVAVPAECRVENDASSAREELARRSDAAARCFARGEVLSRMTEPESWSRAAAAYKAASDLRPGFALARYRSAGLVAKLATPQTEGSYTSLVDADSVPGVVSAEAQAVGELEQRELGVPVTLQSSLAFNRYLAAILGAERSGIAQALDETRIVEALEPEDRSFAYNEGVMLFALGRIDEAQALYDRTLPLSGNDDDEMVAGAMSDLEVLRAKCQTLPWLDADRCARIGERADVLEGRFAASGWNDAKLRALPGIAPASFRATLMPKGIGWTANVDGTASQTQRYRIVVWRMNPQWGAWYVLPLASYQPDGAVVWRNGATLQDSRLVLRESSYHECLAMQDRYRVDLYRDAVRVASIPIDVGLAERTPFDAAAFRDVGVALCYPHGDAAWSRLSNHDGSLSGGYRASDGSRGVYLYAFVAPRFGARQSTVERRQLETAVNATLGVIGVDDLRSGRYIADTNPRCGDLWDRWSAPHEAFAGRAASAIAKAWTESDGLIHVGVAWHKSSAPPNDRLGCELLTSITTVDPDPR